MEKRKNKIFILYIKMADKTHRGKCANKAGRPCKGKDGNKNKRGGCANKAGRPCGKKK
tara:strand:- start:1259 stop:1432 length:174 start_codon:yes stop_codon:yes gene_type:complete